MTGSFWVLLLALYLYGTTLLMLRVIHGQWSISEEPTTWFYASWVLGLVLLVFPLFEYFEQFSHGSVALLGGSLAAFSLGVVAAAFWGKQQSRQAQLTRERPDMPNLRTALVLLLMGLVGSSLLLTNSVLGGDLSLFDRLDTDNLADIRASHMQLKPSKIGPLFGIANLSSAVGGLGIAMLFYLRGMRSLQSAAELRLFRLAQLVLLFNIVIGLIGFGSRMFAVFVILVAALAFMQGRWAIGERVLPTRLNFRRLAVFVLTVVVTAATLYAAATVFLEQRVQSQDPQSLLYRTHRATLSPVTYELTRDDKTAQYFLLSVSYFTTPIATLTYYADLPDARAPGPFWGQYNFPAVARWGRRLTFTSDPFAWEMARYNIFKPLADIGFGTNVWSTLVRDLVADFTKPGALIFLMLLGFFTQRLHELQSAKPAMRRAVLLVYLRIVIGFAGLISTLFMPQLHWPLYLAVFLLWWQRPQQRVQWRHSVEAAGAGGRAPSMRKSVLIGAKLR